MVDTVGCDQGPPVVSRPGKAHRLASPTIRAHEALTATAHSRSCSGGLVLKPAADGRPCRCGPVLIGPGINERPLLPVFL